MSTVERPAAPAAPVERSVAAPPSPSPASAPGPVAPAGRRLTRPTRGRLIAGVCRGLADHLRVDVRAVRVVFLALALTGPAGWALYAALWVLAPQQVDEGPAEADSGRGRSLARLLALAALVAGVALFAQLVAAGTPTGWPVAAGAPLLAIGAGLAVLWWQADDAQRSRWRAATGTTRLAGALRLLVGAVLAVGGTVTLLAGSAGLVPVLEVLVPLAVGLVGLALASGPWWLRMARELTAERAARIREQERAEVAAHVHDSVLHTLTLIQRHVDDPRTVARLARAQERELRGWLYRPGAGAAGEDARLRAALEEVAAEVEDAHGVPVEVVVVGDARLDEGLRALLLAAREAMVNAAKYGGGAPVSVYAEVEAGRATVFVRDRGPGFDLAAVPADRLGVRQSVIGRMERHGGRALLRGAPGEGTEVQLEMPTGEAT